MDFLSDILSVALALAFFTAMIVAIRLLDKV